MKDLANTFAREEVSLSSQSEGPFDVKSSPICKRGDSKNYYRLTFDIPLRSSSTTTYSHEVPLQLR
jgi:hypothetical protein